METTITTVEGLISIIESGKGGCVSLSRCQLADLFGVYYGTITANIKVLIKSGAVNPSFKGTVVQVGQAPLDTPTTAKVSRPKRSQTAQRREQRYEFPTINRACWCAVLTSKSQKLWAM